MDLNWKSKRNLGCKDKLGEKAGMVERIHELN